MPLLLETIKIEDGSILNLPYHQNRCNYSREKLCYAKEQLELSDYLSPPPQGTYRCRILYAQKIQSIEYIPYRPKPIQRLKVVSSSVEYPLKYANRDALNELLLRHPDVDEVIIEKDGFLTDTTISNIAFFDGTKWYTPHKPLLKGTMRQKLLDEGFLQTKAIRKEDISHYQQVALINAMLGFSILNGETLTKVIL